MINLDIDVLVNGKPIRVDEELNDLLASYIVKRVGMVERTSILDNVTPVKHFKPAKVYGESDVKVPRWTDEEVTKFALRVEEIRRDEGIAFGKICQKLVAEFPGRTPESLYQKLQKLKKEGVIRIV